MKKEQLRLAVFVIGFLSAMILMFGFVLSFYAMDSDYPGLILEWIGYPPVLIFLIVMTMVFAITTINNPRNMVIMFDRIMNSKPGRWLENL